MKAISASFVRSCAIRQMLVVACLLAATACQHVSSRHGVLSDLRRAIIVKEDVAAAIAFEKELKARYETAPAPGQPWFRFLPGTSRVLVVAGHATAQTRQGRTKIADGGTGSLAFTLNRLAKTPVIYTTLKSPSDPNFYDDNDFKTSLSQVLAQCCPAFVIDLHTSHWFRPYDADLGDMNGKSLLGKEVYLEKLVNCLREEGLQDLSRDYFAGVVQHTVIKWVASRGVPCVQLEISATCFPHETDIGAHRFAQLLQALVRFCTAVDSGDIR